MGAKYVVVVVLLFSISTCFANYGAASSMLINDLFKAYDKDLIPLKEVSEPVKLSLGLDLAYFVDLDPTKGLLTNGGWFKFSWNDFRLSWQPEDYGGIQSLHVPSSRLWLPDVELFNGYEELPRGDQNAIVSSDGNILWIPVIKRFASVCEMGDLVALMAKQEGLVCNISLGSWTYSHELIELSLMDEVKVQDSWTSNPSVEIVDSSSVLDVSYYECCPDEAYSKIITSLRLKPKPWMRRMMGQGMGGMGGMGAGMGEMGGMGEGMGGHMGGGQGDPINNGNAGLAGNIPRPGEGRPEGAGGGGYTRSPDRQHTGEEREHGGEGKKGKKGKKGRHNSGGRGF